MQEAMEQALVEIKKEAGEFEKAFGRHYGGQIEEYRTEDAEIVLVTSVHLGDARDNAIAAPFYARIEDLASVNDLPVARVHEYWRKKISDGVEFRKLVQFDMVHPTVEGYRLMAEAIMEVFI